MLPVPDLPRCGDGTAALEVIPIAPGLQEAIRIWRRYGDAGPDLSGVKATLGGVSLHHRDQVVIRRIRSSRPCRSRIAWEMASRNATLQLMLTNRSSARCRSALPFLWAPLARMSPSHHWIFRPR